MSDSINLKAAGAPKQAFRAYVYRVEEGLGNACALRLPDGRFGVIDWGTRKGTALRSLLNEVGNSTLAFVAATHAHADHTLGLDILLTECVRREIKVERLVYPTSTTHQGFDYLNSARLVAKQYKIPMSSVGVDAFERSDGSLPDPPSLADGPGWEVTLLAPPTTLTAVDEIRALEKDEAPGNSTSLVILGRFTPRDTESARGRVLFTGDVTIRTLQLARQTSERRENPELSIDNQLFIVPHHGSNGNFSNWMLQAIHGCAAISCPPDNKHHPSDQVVNALAEHLRTDDGSRLFCTSSAGCCDLQQHGVTSNGVCFGNMQFEVPADVDAQLEESDADGEQNRPLGLCGKVGSIAGPKSPPTTNG